MEIGLGADIQGAAALRQAQRPEQAAEAARFLTSVFMRDLIDQMWKTVPEGGLVPKSTGEKIFRDFLNDRLATDLSRSLVIGGRQNKDFSGLPLQNGAGATDTRKGGARDGFRLG